MSISVRRFCMNHISTILVLLYSFQSASSNREVKIEDYSNTTNSSDTVIRLADTGPNSTVLLLVDARRLGNNSVSNLTITSHEKTVLILSFNGFLMDLECHTHSDHFTFSDGSIEFHVCHAEVRPGAVTPARTFHSGLIWMALKPGSEAYPRLKFECSVTVAIDRLCLPEEFKCGNNLCVWLGLMCDRINNCGDGSDERIADWTSNCLWGGILSALIMLIPLLWLPILLVLYIVIKKFIHSRTVRVIKRAMRRSTWLQNLRHRHKQEKQEEGQENESSDTAPADFSTNRPTTSSLEESTPEDDQQPPVIESPETESFSVRNSGVSSGESTMFPMSESSSDMQRTRNYRIPSSSGGKHEVEAPAPVEKGQHQGTE